MNKTSAFAQLVSVVGDAAVRWRRLQGTPDIQAVGAMPTIPDARPQGKISMNRFVEITSTAPAKIFGMYGKKVRSA